MIKFPAVHIAESATNRLLNIIDGIEDAAPLSLPSTPEPPPIGAVLDEKLSQPTGGAAPDEQAIKSVARGDSALESLITE